MRDSGLRAKPLFAVGSRVIVSWMGEDVEAEVVQVAELTRRNTRQLYRVAIEGRRPAYAEHEMRRA